MPQITLFTPFESQKAFIDKFVETDDLFGCLVAPRGSGKTLAAMNIALYWALLKPNQKIGWCAPTFSQSKSVLDQIVSAAHDIVESSNRQEATIVFINGSTIKFLSSDSADNIRGFRFSHLILDEFAYIKQKVIDTILLPTLNPNGRKCLMVSTPAGKNHMYTWYMKEDVVSHKIPLTECPYISQTLIDEAKKSLPPDLFAQEYLAEFRDAANDVFVGIDRVAFLGQYTEGRGQDAYVGIDTGLVDDYSVLYLISPIGKTLHIERINNENINTIATLFSNIMSKYNIVGGNVEKNGIGAAMFDLLKKRFRKLKGFTTTQASKTEAVRKLINDIELTNIELPSEQLCPELHTEFANYSYKMSQTGNLSFGHSPGAKDDIIDALLMANLSRVQFMERKPIRISGISKVKPTFGRPK